MMARILQPMDRMRGAIASTRLLTEALSTGLVEGGGMSPGMMYMPLSPHGLSPHGLGHPQQQWPAMMPWMGPYFMHPSQHAQPEPINLMSAGRSTSAPDNPASLSWASQPMQTSGDELKCSCFTKFNLLAQAQCISLIAIDDLELPLEHFERQGNIGKHDGKILLAGSEDLPACRPHNQCEPSGRLEQERDIPAPHVWQGLASCAGQRKPG